MIKKICGPFDTKGNENINKSKNKAMEYSKQFWDHFLHPRNVGTIQDADGIGVAGDAACGDYLKIWIKVENEHIAKITFQCKGCPAAIATSSIMTEIAQGKHVDQAAQITDEIILEAIGGLPEDKQHCSNLGASALYEAIIQYVFKPV